MSSTRTNRSSRSFNAQFVTIRQRRRQQRRAAKELLTSSSADPPPQPAIDATVSMEQQQQDIEDARQTTPSTKNDKNKNKKMNEKYMKLKGWRFYLRSSSFRQIRSFEHMPEIFLSALQRLNQLLINRTDSHHRLILRFILRVEPIYRHFQRQLIHNVPSLTRRAPFGILMKSMKSRLHLGCPSKTCVSSWRFWRR